MTGTEELRLKMDLPPISQIVLVVNDPHKVANQCSSLFGMGPWAIYEFVPEKHWIMEGSKAKLSKVKFFMAKAMLHDVEMCFMKCTEGKSLHKEFLKTHGDGLFNLVFSVPNYDDMYDKFVKAGFKPLEWVETYVPTYKGNMKACYFDTRSVGGILIELRWGSWIKF